LPPTYALSDHVELVASTDRKSSHEMWFATHTTHTLRSVCISHYTTEKARKNTRRFRIRERRTITKDMHGGGAKNPGLFSLMTLNPKASTFVSVIDGTGDAAEDDMLLAV